jgi:mannose-1-phosphate guanylyltransferase
MAGGIGSRFWPLSTEDNPKQFLDILGTGKSLIQMTFDRFKQVVPEENIYVLTNLNYKSKVVDQLNIDGEQVLCEPMRKNTAPCIAYATAKIHKKDPNSLILVTPSDHLIVNEMQFFSDLKLGIDHARDSEDLVTYGIKPNRPDTGYGYIEFNAKQENTLVSAVKQFREKPNLSLAEEFIQKGNFYWNSGMFAWKSETIIRSFKHNAKELYRVFFENTTHYNTDSEAQFLKECFTVCEDISIDYAILEKDPNISLVLSSFDWSDLGTWGSIKSVVKKDDEGNFKNSNAIHLFNSKNCVIQSAQNKTVLVDGLDDFIVIDTPERLMILSAQNEQELKSFVKQIEKK